MILTVLFVWLLPQRAAATAYLEDANNYTVMLGGSNIVRFSASSLTPMVIYGRSTDESLTLKYYDAAKGVLYTIPDAVKL